MRVAFVFLLLGVLCFGRDNPFAPVENIAKFTQMKKRDNNFKEAQFTLPDSSRILKKMIVVYQNLDGSLTQKSITIDKKIDWHNAFVLKYKNTTLHVESKMPIKPTQMSMATQKIKSYSFKGFIKFKVGNKRLVISTKDSKIRDFLVSNPYKIVFDFRRDTNFLTKTFKVNTPPFVSIVLGNHDKYYRVAIELDGQYIYKTEKKQDEFVITLR